MCSWMLFYNGKYFHYILLTDWIGNVTSVQVIVRKIFLFPIQYHFHPALNCFDVFFVNIKLQFLLHLILTIETFISYAVIKLGKVRSIRLAGNIHQNHCNYGNYGKYWLMKLFFLNEFHDWFYVKTFCEMEFYKNCCWSKKRLFTLHNFHLAIVLPTEKPPEKITVAAFFY